MAAIDVSDGGLGQPAVHAFVVAPSDSEEVTYVTRAVFVGGAGNMAVVMFGGETVTFSGILAGTTLPIRVKKVLTTETTATLMLGLF
jgi:hypothetical protein